VSDDLIELAGKTHEELVSILDDLAKKGVHVALEGHIVEGCGGRGHITHGNPAVTVFGKYVATINSRYEIPSDAHGCPACAHHCFGKIIEGYSKVVVNGLPVAIKGSACQHTGCCGPNAGAVAQGHKMPYQIGLSFREHRHIGVKGMIQV
jgi:uncharacterized Zn-binding protein involved in type VI secretion